jgi:hypothetical protein
MLSITVFSALLSVDGLNWHRHPDKPDRFRLGIVGRMAGGRAG